MVQNLARSGQDTQGIHVFFWVSGFLGVSSQSRVEIGEFVPASRSSGAEIVLSPKEGDHFFKGPGKRLLGNS